MSPIKVPRPVEIQNTETTHEGILMNGPFALHLPYRKSTPVNTFLQCFCYLRCCTKRCDYLPVRSSPTEFLEL